MNWFVMAMKKYVQFSGRSQRSEYWFFQLFFILIYLALVIVGSMLGKNAAMIFGLLAVVFSLACLLPSLAVTVRRLHDTDRSGWWILIGLIPIIGGIILLAFMVLDSQPGENRFGPNPKE